MKRIFPVVCFLVACMILFPGISKADGLSFTYTSPQTQTAVVSDTGFATVIFTGSIKNTSNSPITFELQGGPVPFEPFVASFVSGVPFPGLTLAPGQSTANMDLAVVTINPFDPSLKYPGTVDIVLPAITLTGATITPNEEVIEVVRAVPEPSTLGLLVAGMLGVLWLGRRERIQS